MYIGNVYTNFFYFIKTNCSNYCVERLYIGSVYRNAYTDIFNSLIFKLLCRETLCRKCNRALTFEKGNTALVYE